MSKTIHLQGTLKASLYTFATPKSSPSSFVMADSTTSIAQEAIWHARLGHPAPPFLSRALSSCNPAIVISCNKLSELCVHFPLAKSHKLPLSLSSSHASHPLDLLHLDLWGPAPCSATSGARYVFFIIDDFSRYTWLYFLSTKDQALPSFINFQKLVERQINTSIKHLQSDNGGEFLAFKSYLQSQGISHQFSCPHTPEQNGRVERKIRHLVETGLALSAQASLPLKYWMQSF